MYVTRKGIAVGQRFLLVMEFNIHEKKLIVSKTVSYCKKIEKFVLLTFDLAPKMSRPRPPIHSWFVECRQVKQKLCYFEQNMLFLVN